MNHNDIYDNEQMRAFFLAHREEDVRKLALKYKQQDGMDMQFALQQIDGWQRARTKLPMWAEHDGIIFPPHISMEQCSSEVTARYKARLLAAVTAQPAAAPAAPSIVPPAALSTAPGVAPSGEKPAAAADSELGVCNTTTLIDLTGGFGVDFSYMSQQVHEAIYVEQQEHLCQIAEHNFRELGLTNVAVKHARAEEFLDEMGSFYAEKRDSTVIFIDPARRDTHGKKTYAISDCTPDVVTLLPRLKAVASTIIIKLSPMLDHHEAIRLLPGITEVHIVSTKNECKELLLVVETPAGASSGAAPVLPKGEVKLICINDDEIFQTTINAPQNKTTTKNLLNETATESLLSETTTGKLLSEPFKSTSPLGSMGGTLLLIPNASIMKAGCFSIISKHFGVAALDADTHLFIAKNTDSIADFPGRTFTIHAVCTMNKRELKTALSGITHANIATRNFPLSASDLRKRLKLKDGGEWYIFGTTVLGRHTLLVCKKLENSLPTL